MIIQDKGKRIALVPGEIQGPYSSYSVYSPGHNYDNNQDSPWSAIFREGDRPEGVRENRHFAGEV